MWDDRTRFGIWCPHESERPPQLSEERGIAPKFWLLDKLDRPGLHFMGVSHVTLKEAPATALKLQA